MSEFKKYRCLECEHLYDEEKGDPDSGIPAGKTFPIAGIVQSAAHPKAFLN